jgi:hypothetical protein|nr:hypothetical protein [Bacteroides sp.]
MGASVSDFYHGAMDTGEIASEITGKLMALNLFEKARFFQWIDHLEIQFRELTVSDGSRWTLLKGKDKVFYLHIHPSRHSLHTLRIKTSILKSAVALVAYEHFFRVMVSSPDTVNFLRMEYLGFSPVKEDQMKGIWGLAQMLRDRCKKT